MTSRRLLLLPLLLLLGTEAPAKPLASSPTLPTVEAQVSEHPAFQSDEITEFIGCGFQCVMNWSVSASSSLPASRASNYQAENTKDGQASTAWAEGVPGSGVGQWIECKFIDPAKGKHIDAIQLAIGYQKSKEHYQKNARPKKICVNINGRSLVWLQILDEPRTQTFALPQPLPVGRGDRLRLVIEEVYPGTSFSDCCISELGFLGGPGH